MLDGAPESVVNAGVHHKATRQTFDQVDAGSHAVGLDDDTLPGRVAGITALSR